MAILLSNVSNALTKVLLPYIQDNFTTLHPLLDQIKRDKSVQFFNNAFYAPIRTSRHGGVTNLANDGSNLVSSKASIGQASVTPAIVTGTFDISDLVIAATATGKGAVERQLTWQASTLTDDFAKDINRQYYGDGAEIIAQVAGSVGAGTMSLKLKDSSLDDGRSIDNYGTVNGDLLPAEYIFPDMVIAVGTPGTALGTVTSVNGNTVVVTGAPAIAANNSIYKVDGSGAGAGTSGILGMRAALSSTTGTSTYAGVARSTYGWAPQLGTTAQALTLSAMEQQYLAAKKFSKASDRYAIFVNKTLYKKYGDILTSMRRTVDTADLLGGWTGLEFVAGAGKVGVFLDYDCPDGEVLIVNLDSWTVCQVRDMQWAEDPNGGALIRTRNTIQYQATMMWFTNLICLAPAANARLTQQTA